MRIEGGERALTVFGYLPLVAGLLLLFRVKRGSMFAQFHIRQSWVLFLLLVAVDLLLLVLLFLMPFLDSWLIFIAFLSWALYGFLMLAGMVKAGMGERYRMPVVADVALMLRM